MRTTSPAWAGHSQPELARFRQILLAKRRQLLRDLESLSDEARGTGDDNASHRFDDCADIGSEEHERDLTLDLIGSAHELLKEIDAALERLAEGRFGICEATGKSVGRARLTVQPWARCCIEAARAREGRQSRGAGDAI